MLRWVRIAFLCATANVLLNQRLISHKSWRGAADARLVPEALIAAACFIVVRSLRPDPRREN